jgi:hypothetical protein
MDDMRAVQPKIENFLLQNAFDVENKDLVFKRCLNESWFSNTLAWLLDPKGSHNLGVKFANEFLRTIARLRSEGSKNKDSGKNKYARKKSLLKWGKSGKGMSPHGFSLKNASAVREFYLSKSIKKRDPRGPKYCDVAFFDLDRSDGLVLIIENKLFTQNHPGQLEEYYKTVEDKFRRAKIREYVYLTLYGSDPCSYQSHPPWLYKYWVRMSWSENILNILNELKSDNENSELKKLRNILSWLQAIHYPALKNHVEKLRDLMLKAGAECLGAELKRLNEGKTGSWDIRTQKGQGVTIGHTSRPRTLLYLELLPNLSITLQSRKKGKPIFDKIIVPYGSNSDQIFNLLDIAARDVYHYHFKGNPNRYLANRRRQSANHSKEKNEYRDLFDFVYKNQHELQVLFTLSDSIWEAQKKEIEETQCQPEIPDN